MAAFFWNRKPDIEQRLESYFVKCDDCFNSFEKGISVFLQHGPDDNFKVIAEKTHKLESEADDLRRDIEHTLYGKALLPDSRGDLLGILETFDRLPNACEAVLFALLHQRVILPTWMTNQYDQLCKANVEAYHLTRKAIDDLFTNPKVTLHTSKAVDEKESECDRLERCLIRSLFESELELAEKLLLRDVILLTGNISDRAEIAADRIGIVAIKRQI